MLRALVALTLALVFAVPQSVMAALYWEVPNTNSCFVPSSSLYLYLGGPASGWSAHLNYGAGPEGCHYYTLSTTGSVPENTAAFYLPLSTSYNGSYRVHEFVPCDAHSSAASSKWRAYPLGTSNPYYSVSRLIGGYCDSWVNPDNRTYYGSLGGYILQIDNVGAGFWVPVDVVTYQP